MDTRDGKIFPLSELDARIKAAAEADARQYFKEMTTPPTPKQLRTGKIERNDRCPCGSGKKFKVCCQDNPSIIRKMNTRPDEPYGPGGNDPREWMELARKKVAEAGGQSKLVGIEALLLCAADVHRLRARMKSVSEEVRVAQALIDQLKEALEKYLPPDADDARSHP